MPEQTEKKLTGYPSIDKPWLKYYSEEAINAPLPELTMYQYIWENNKDYLSDIALRYYGTKITYGKLFENIKKAAGAFYAMGVRAGDIVTIMSMHTPETIYAIYGLNYIGAVANMVYMTLAEKEILHTLKNTESKLFLVMDAALERVNKIKDEISCLIVVLGTADSMTAHMKLGYKLKTKPKKHNFMTWKTFLKKASSETHMSNDHDAPAVIVYTSGTTGEPKGVVLNSDGINAVVAQLVASGKQYNRGETFFDNIPPFFGFGISMLHLGIYSGIEMILWLQLHPDEIAKGFAKAKPNRYAGGPPVVDPIMHTLSGKLDYILEFTGGGDSLSPEKEAEINQFLESHGSRAKYTTGYGMSEAISVVCAQQNHLYRAGSIGIPLPRTNIKIVAVESGQELQYGEIGEMLFQSPNLMMHYYNNPSATEKIVDIDANSCRWLHTGDLGYVDEDGYVYFKGRLKRIYLAGGKDGRAINKIFPTHIEEVIEKQKNVEICGVVVLPDDTLINIPVAFVQLREKHNHVSRIVRIIENIVKEELAEHMQPQTIHIIDSMPMTPSGKIDYQALERMAKSF